MRDSTTGIRLLSLVLTITSVFLSFGTLSVHALADSRCYLRDGTAEDRGQPCYPDAEHSHCCHNATHLCLSNFLCFDTLYNHIIEGNVAPLCI